MSLSVFWSRHKKRVFGPEHWILCIFVPLGQVLRSRIVRLDQNLKNLILAYVVLYSSVHGVDTLLASFDRYTHLSVMHIEDFFYRNTSDEE